MITAQLHMSQSYSFDDPQLISTSATKSMHAGSSLDIQVQKIIYVLSTLEIFKLAMGQPILQKEQDIVNFKAGNDIQ